jgi:hypothetical protein
MTEFVILPDKNNCFLSLYRPDSVINTLMIYNFLRESLSGLAVVACNRSTAAAMTMTTITAMAVASKIKMTEANGTGQMVLRSALPIGSPVCQTIRISSPVGLSPAFRWFYVVFTRGILAVIQCRLYPRHPLCGSNVVFTRGIHAVVLMSSLPAASMLWFYVVFIRGFHAVSQCRLYPRRLFCVSMS